MTVERWDFQGAEIKKSTLRFALCRFATKPTPYNAMTSQQRKHSSTMPRFALEFFAFLPGLYRNSASRV